MNSKSPGNSSIEDDIEMIGLEDIAERSKSPTRQNGINPSQPRDLDDSDDEDNELGDDGRALLSSHVRTRTRERISLPIGVYWPQIKNIVAEVRGKPKLRTDRHDRLTLIERIYSPINNCRSLIYREIA